MSDSAAASASPSGAQARVQTLGEYWLLAQIARGGMGLVYLALAPKSEDKPAHLVVVKELITVESPTETQLLAFADEAEVAIRLEHPNVVRTLDVGVEDSRHYMVLEYLDGQPLSRIRKRMTKSEQTVTEAWLHVIAEALVGLHAAHELKALDGTPLGLVHRDISPHNLFVTYAGEIKVMDFGIAKTVESSTHTSSGVLKGKVSFMAPEQVRGVPLDRRADLFAMALVLFELVAGKRLWEGKNDIDVVRALLVGDLPDPLTLAPDLHPGIVKVLRKALASEPAERYETALAMCEALREVLALMGADPYTPAALGAQLSALFEAEQARTAAVVDAQVRILLEEGETDLEHLLAPDPGPSNPPPASVQATPSDSVSPHVLNVLLVLLVIGVFVMAALLLRRN